VTALQYFSLGLCHRAVRLSTYPGRVMWQPNETKRIYLNDMDNGSLRRGFAQYLVFNRICVICDVVLRYIFLHGS